MERESAGDAGPGLRERKAAATRVALADAVGERLGRHALDEITVEEIAEAARVSRVTFFNYFPTKEHALDFLMQAWLARVVRSEAAAGLDGREAIEHLFHELGAFMAASPGRGRRLMSYFAGRPPDRPLPTLGRSELELLAPGLAPEDVPRSLGEHLLRRVAEARRAGRLEVRGTTYELAHLLGSALFGGCLIGHSSPDLDWVRVFDHHARCLLGPDPKRTQRTQRRKKA